jgi:hypothetical protein
MRTPPQCEPHAADYKNQAWADYSLFELAMWVVLLLKRAGHRDNFDKRAKDLYDAENYLAFYVEARKVGRTMRRNELYVVHDILGFSRCLMNEKAFERELQTRLTCAIQES